MFKKIQELCQFWESAFEPLCTQHDFYYIQNNILKKYRTPTLNVDGFQLENVEDEFLRVRQCLEQKMPIQYIFNEAFFMDLVLYVDENVLIPRPETEELVFLIEKKLGHIKNLKVLDIGTGSGCIGIYLKRKFPSWRVEALDFSISALLLFPIRLI
jgi:release factor glutamine methyltransferase